MHVNLGHDFLKRTELYIVYVHRAHHLFLETDVFIKIDLVVLNNNPGHTLQCQQDHTLCNGVEVLMETNVQ